MLNKIAVNLQSSTKVSCERCGNDTFVVVYYLRKFSKLLMGSQNDVLYPHETFACSKCHHVN